MKTNELIKFLLLHRCYQGKAKGKRSEIMAVVEMSTEKVKFIIFFLGTV